MDCEEKEFVFAELKIIQAFMYLNVYMFFETQLKKNVSMQVQIS